MPRRVTFLDYGESIDLIDRPADQPGAVTLGQAYKIPGHGWYVRVGGRRHTDPCLTKAQAKDLLRTWGQQALTQTSEEEAATRPAHDSDAYTKDEAVRIWRVRQRLTFGIEPAGIRLHLDGTRHRILIESPRSQKHMPPLVALLDQAAELGAIHGRCNTQAEIAADLLDQPRPPGHVLYDIAPDRSLTMHHDGTVTTLPIPARLRPFYLIGQTARALGNVFRLAGELADEPGPPPAPATDPTPPGDSAGPVPPTVQVVRDALTEPATHPDHPQ